MKKHILRLTLPLALCLTLLAGCGDAAPSSSENSTASTASSSSAVSTSSKATVSSKPTTISSEQAAVSSERADVSSVGLTSNISLTIDAYLKPVPGKSDAYNKVIEAFDELLLGKRNTKSAEDGDDYSIHVYNGLGEKEYSDIFGFALLDVTGDGIPELHASNDHYYIYSYDQKNDQIVCIYGSGTNYMNGNIYLLENGSMFSYRSTTGTFYTFTTFAADGSTTELSFSCYEPNDSYEFDGEYMTKEEWDALTKDYFAASEKPASMEWYDYGSALLLDVMNSEKPFIAQNGSEVLLRDYRASNGEQTSTLKVKAHAFMGLRLSGPDELVLKCSTDIAEHDVYMILRLDDEDKKIYGHLLNVKEQLEIKANGTLMKTTDENWKEIFELALAKNSKTALSFEVIASQVGDFYQISDVPVTKKLIDTYFSKWQEKSDVEWLTDYLPE